MGLPQVSRKAEMRHASLFSGIGGFDLAAEWMGWENVFHCEWMEFPRKVLDYYWPNADSHIDICKTDFKKYAKTIDILTGGFPCQPFSTAGKRKGTDDERYLWGEMLRAVQEIKPQYVIAENVFGITNIDGGLVFEQVCLDLEAEGYEVQPFIIPAASKGAYHKRYRVWFVGIRKVYESKPIIKHASSIRQEWGLHEEQYKNATRQQSSKRNALSFKISTWENYPTQYPICRGNDGIPLKLDGITFSKWRSESIKGYGNAIVPQVALEIFKQISPRSQ
jgi:DNA (cytosine-5)-methyltransferase 1